MDRDEEATKDRSGFGGKTANIQLGNEKWEAIKDDEEAVTSFINRFPPPSLKPSWYPVLNENKCSLIERTWSSLSVVLAAILPDETETPTKRAVLTEDEVQEKLKVVFDRAGAEVDK